MFDIHFKCRRIVSISLIQQIPDQACRSNGFLVSLFAFLQYNKQTIAKNMENLIALCALTFLQVFSTLHHNCKQSGYHMSQTQHKADVGDGFQQIFKTRHVLVQGCHMSPGELQIVGAQRTQSDYQQDATFLFKSTRQIAMAATCTMFYLRQEHVTQWLRVFTNQREVKGNIIVVQGLPENDKPATVALYGLILVTAGVLKVWAAPACNNPIFAEIVPPHMRNLVYAFDRCFEGAIAACATPIVGILAQTVFGFTVSTASFSNKAHSEFCFVPKKQGHIFVQCMT